MNPGLKAIIVGIIIAFIIIAMYILRARSNRTSDARLQFIIKNYFLANGDGVKQIPAHVRKVTIKNRTPDTVLATIEYRPTGGEKYQHIDITYKIGNYCYTGDTNCLII